ncbi:M16 family metallopeptidase [Carboxydothermus pertinax]|uniref:Peptidase M16 n=1 Tax=Carboxydothermus pertinax TaxID=870242 RepID=A0A1L8CVW5_9THEO|nr:pitrilysin family protein [Carboxydothermus pertinax]GAV23095.1 peptidase M16 [Carboxydothermus pertinax]
MIRVTTLPNKITVLVEEIPYVRSAAVGLWFKVGSRNERRDESGISHFIEHMMFKGTANRTAREIAESLDQVGGQLNAFTTKEYTCYYARVLDEHTNLALEILYDMVFNSKFAEEDIEKEKNVVIEEVRMYEDAPDELIHDLLTEVMWNNHPLGRPILGEIKDIESFNRDKILDYYKRHYTPDNLIIAVAGRVDYQELLEKITDLFGGLGGRHKGDKITIPEFNLHSYSRRKNTEQVHLCLGTKGYSLTDDRIYAINILSTILGGGISSRLFQELREKHGLVYSVYSYTTAYQDAGLFGIYAGLGPNKVEEALELIQKELNELKTGKINDEELERARQQIKGNLLLSLESVTTRMSRLAKSYLYHGKIISPEEIVAKVFNVSMDSIKAMAQEISNLDNFTKVSIGPWEGF